VDVPPPVSEGVTPSERYLARLCRQSFLRLWSWPNVYRDQRAGPNGEGKEVCDLLATFDRHIFLFSDKYCNFPDSGNLKTDWFRWFKRAVWKGAEQLWGAERWIREHPDRLFRDSQCTAGLPINLPATADTIFHRIVVAHGASDRCQKHFGGGSGSLIIAPSIVGKSHFDASALPFTVGTLDPGRFVHVMDDVTLDIVLGTVDTVSDLAGYLDAKEKLLTSGNLIQAAGEEELLAVYLTTTDTHGRHTFDPLTKEPFSVIEGIWDRFQSSPQRVAQLEANEISYTWDRLIDEFAKHALGGTQYFRSDHSVADTERGLRIMAMEDRTTRRMLATALIDVMHRGHENDRFTRLVRGQTPSDREQPRYVFLSLKRPPNKTSEEYREVRRNFLEAHCLVVRGDDAAAKHIIGIALSPIQKQGTTEPWHGEDLMYLDGTQWDDTLQADAERLKGDLEILVKPRGYEFTDREYPVVTRASATERRPKGRDRNRRCACGSGKKVKNCPHP
jgi:hypothetical protein